MGMRAIVVSELGGPGVMVSEEQPDPRPGPGQVLVRVAAAGVNFIDIYRRSGVYKTPVPHVPGGEGAGVVTAVGEGVTEFAPGDRVAWAEGPGSYAEQVAVPARAAVPVPEGIDLKVAAAAMLQGLTAHYLCHSTFPVTQGAVTVVHAAAGGVGLLLTQMIKHLGGTVIGTFTGGTNGTQLIVSFNSISATPQAVQALADDIFYSNASSASTTSGSDSMVSQWS